MDNKLITIGKIGKNQGNKGEVRVIPLTDFPERYTVIEQVYLDNGETVTTRKIEDVWFHKNYVIIKFAGIDNIGQALALKNDLIKIPETELVPLEENEYYIYQLLGFKIYTKKEEFLGHLQDIITTGGTDIFCVGNDENPREYMLPATKEIITDIDFDSQIIRVNPIPGLLDI